jgi:formamidopyrimidine-DNA glycosylase
MPELPEVETIRRSLERLIVGQTIAAVEVRESRLRRPLMPNFATALTGRTIEQITRRGKYLYLELDDGRVWLVHLGMTGQLVLGQQEELLEPHDHLLFSFGDGRCLHYNDTRRFGLMAVGSKEEIAMLIELGVEPLSETFSAHYLWEKTQATRRTIKDLLMDQRVVAGIGNIYACEILFHAGVLPQRLSSTLDFRVVQRIVKKAKAVLREAIRHRGSSISDYVDGEGDPGTYQARFRVYDLEGKPCRKCRAAIAREMRSGRSTFFCPTCQQ